MKVTSRILGRIEFYYNYVDILELPITKENLEMIGKNWPSYVIVRNDNGDIESIINGRDLARLGLSAQIDTREELLTEYTKEEILEHAKKTPGVKHVEYCCKHCLAADQKVVPYSEFDGEVIERCPKCRGEEITAHPLSFERIVSQLVATGAILKRGDYQKSL